MLRVAACVVLARVVGGKVIDRAFDRFDTQTLRPVLQAIVLSLVLASLLLVRPKPEPKAAP